MTQLDSWILKLDISSRLLIVIIQV